MEERDENNGVGREGYEEDVKGGEEGAGGLRAEMGGYVGELVACHSRKGEALADCLRGREKEKEMMVRCLRYV